MSAKLSSKNFYGGNLMVKCFVALVIFFCSVGNLFAQTETKVTINVDKVLIRTALERLQKETKVHFVYDEENIDQDKRVSLSYTQAPLKIVLEDFCKQTSLRYEVKRNLILILPGKADRNVNRQSFLMKGVVTDEDGESIIGATVMIGGTSKGTVTDINGQYTLEVQSGDLVSFTFVGMTDKVIKAQVNKKMVNVQLESNATALADVVITGYQTLSKERATGSFDKVDSSVLSSRPTADLSTALQGLVAGMQATEKEDGSIDFLIRGSSSLYADKKPLLVVDGFPIQGDFSSINPNDVESVTVLKDAAAASIWGARSANGVIVVTTKKGKKDKVQVDVQAFVRIGTNPDLEYIMNQADSRTMVDYEMRAFENNWKMAAWEYAPTFSKIQNSLTLAQELYYANKNNECRGQYINRVHFFNKTLFVEGITGPCTDGYHPEPSLPTFSMKGETPSFGVLQQVKPSTTYMFETAVKTDGDAGIIAWWKDVDNNAYIGFDTKNHNWYLRTIINGKEKEEYFTLPKDFRWGVYHHLRIERNQDCLKVWLDEIPSPQKHLFTKIIPVTEPGVPGVFDRTKKALFEGVTYTIGFDDDRIQLKEHSEILKGDFLDHYEFSFQLSGLSDCKMSGSYPVYVDKDNYVKAQFNGITRMLEVVVVKQGQQILDKKYPLEHLQMVYPDVKYTDFVEKCYRFISPSWINALYLNRHEVGNKAEFVDDMFSKFTIEYLNEGKWYPLNNSGATVAEHLAYNRLSFTPIKTEGIRFINKDAQDLERHIYKLGIQEQLKESYNFRAVRRGNKLYLFVDGRELGRLDIHYPASCVGFCSGNYSPVYKGILYYHIGN